MARQATVRLAEDLADETVARVQGTGLNQLTVESLADAIDHGAPTRTSPPAPSVCSTATARSSTVSPSDI
jgi:hypothetical protein